ncbi:MAG: hypothetical protein RIA69_12250 [Cyclobacteriaceae bacterium]
MANTTFNDHFTDPKIKATSTMTVYFKGIENDKIRASFLKVLSRFQALHPYEITLTKKRLETSTMQAQPLFSLRSLFGGARKYEIKLAKYVKDSNKILVADLPEDVLTGWFAHELGHLVDYEGYNGLEMLWYGLKYLFNDDFKRSAERNADMIAILRGFDQEIIASKEYILNNDFLGPKYQNQIKKYYMSIEDVRITVKNATSKDQFNPLDL